MKFSYITGVAEAAKKSPELIQLLELHTQFASITPYAQVSFDWLFARSDVVSSFGFRNFTRTSLQNTSVDFL